MVRIRDLHPPPEEETRPLHPYQQTESSPQTPESQDLSSYLEYSFKPAAYGFQQLNQENHDYHGSQADFNNRLGMNYVFNPSLHNQANFHHLQNNRLFASGNSDGKNNQNYNQLLVPPPYQSRDVQARIVTGHTIEETMPVNLVNTQSPNFLAHPELNMQGNLAGLPSSQSSFLVGMGVPSNSYATEFNVKQPPVSVRGSFPLHSYHGIPVLPGSILTHPFRDDPFQNQNIDPNIAYSSLKRYRATPPPNTFEISPHVIQPESGDHSGAKDAFGVTQNDGGHQRIQQTHQTNVIVNSEVPQLSDVPNNIHISQVAPPAITNEDFLHGKSVSPDTGIQSLVEGEPLDPSSGGHVSTPGMVNSDSMTAQMWPNHLHQPAYPEEQLRGQTFDIQANRLNSGPFLPLPVVPDDPSTRQSPLTLTLETMLGTMPNFENAVTVMAMLAFAVFVGSLGATASATTSGRTDFSFLHDFLPADAVPFLDRLLPFLSLPAFPSSRSPLPATHDTEGSTGTEDSYADGFAEIFGGEFHEELQDEAAMIAEAALLLYGDHAAGENSPTNGHVAYGDIWSDPISKRRQFVPKETVHPPARRGQVSKKQENEIHKNDQNYDGFHGSIKSGLDVALTVYEDLREMAGGALLEMQQRLLGWMSPLLPLVDASSAGDGSGGGASSEGATKLSQCDAVPGAIHRRQLCMAHQAAAKLAGEDRQVQLLPFWTFGVGWLLGLLPVRDLLEDLYAKTVGLQGSCDELFPDCSLYNVDRNDADMNNVNNTDQFVGSSGGITLNGEVATPNGIETVSEPLKLVSPLLQGTMRNQYLDSSLTNGEMSNMQMSESQNTHKIDFNDKHNQMLSPTYYQKPVALKYTVRYPYSVIMTNKTSAQVPVDLTFSTQLPTSSADHNFYNEDLDDIKTLYSELTKHSEELWKLHSSSNNYQKDPQIENLSHNKKWYYFSGDHGWNRNKRFFDLNPFFGSVLELGGESVPDEALALGREDRDHVLSAFSVYVDPNSLVDIDLGQYGDYAFIDAIAGKYDDTNAVKNEDGMRVDGLHSSLDRLVEFLLNQTSPSANE